MLMGRWIAACLIGITARSVVHAQAGAALQSGAPAPTLQALSRETQDLYEHVRPGLVRIQLPLTYWPMSDSDNVIDKWKGKLKPEVLEKLRQDRAVSAITGGPSYRTSTDPTPTTQPGGSVLVAPMPPRLSIYPRPDGGIELGPFSAESIPYDAEIPSIAPKVIGILVDQRGHVLVPLYIDSEAIGAEPLRVTSGDGKQSTATFVGSDRQTNLTVFRLTDPIGTPIRITAGPPADGSLVMVLSPAGDTGRLGIWTGGAQDRGIVVTMDGGVAGFARYGQFLCCAFAQPLVDQLVRTGHVRRAVLGVVIEETETPHGQRAMRIEKVIPGSPADEAGLKPDDFILSMGGSPVGDMLSFAAAIAARNGQTELEVLRGDRTFKVMVVLTQR